MNDEPSSESAASCHADLTAWNSPPHNLHQISDTCLERRLKTELFRTASYVASSCRVPGRSVNSAIQVNYDTSD